MDANGSICRGMLQHRYDSPAALQKPAVLQKPEGEEEQQ
jgi:hypothetical protein